jgi:hypothetical protein
MQSFISITVAQFVPLVEYRNQDHAIAFLERMMSSVFAWDSAAGADQRVKPVSSDLEDRDEREQVRERQREALRSSAGVLNIADYPQWTTHELVSAWVREQRNRDTERLLRKWRGRLTE